MQPEPAPYTSEQVKNEIERVRRRSGAVAAALVVVTILACVVVFVVSIGIPG